MNDDTGCRIEYRRGRWICLTHDFEVDQVLPDAFITNPGPDDFVCPIQKGHAAFARVLDDLQETP